MNLKLLKNRTFTLSVVGSTITLMGDNFLLISLALYVLRLTGSATKYAFIITLSSIPTIALSLFSGLIVDKLEKKKLMIFLDLVRGTILVSLALVNSINSISLFQIYIVSFVFGICNCIYQPCANSVIPSIIEEEHLVKANVINNIFLQIGQVVGPMLAVLIYGSKGITTILILDAITFFIMAFIVLFYKMEKVSSAETGNLRGAIMEEFKIFNNKVVLSLTINGLLSYLFVLPLFSVGLPFIIKNLFGATDKDYGIIQSIYSIASVFIIFTVPIVSKKVKELKALNITMYFMLTSIGCMLPLMNKSIFNFMKINNNIMILFIASIAFMFSLSFSTYGVFFSTTNQKRIQKNYLGRYYSVLSMIFALGSTFGSSLFGFLYDTRVIIYPIIVAIMGMIAKLVLNKIIINRYGNMNIELEVALEKD